MNILITGKDEVLNYIARPENISKRIPNYADRIEFLDQFRQFTDEQAKVTNWGKVAGGYGSMKLIARVPESVLITILAIEPNFLKDKKLIYKWLDQNPEYAAYTRKKKTKSV